MIDDLEQITKAQDGDRNALNYLVGKWHPRLANIFRSKGIYGDADDLAQEVLITVMKNISKLKEPLAFNAWINKIAIRKMSTFFKKSHNIVSLDLDGMAIPSSEGEDETLNKILLNEDRVEINIALDNLPNSYSNLEYGKEARDILMDFYFSEKKITDIAVDRNRPEGTVKRILHVAKNKLAELLPDYKI